MPTFTAIALDTMIEPGTAKSRVLSMNSSDPKVLRRHSISNTMEDTGMDSPSPKLGKVVGLPPMPKLERGVSVPPNAKIEMGVSIPPNTKIERGVSLPPTVKLDRAVAIPYSKLDRSNGVPATEHHWPQVSPALYATPESTPLPDAPSSFPPSPYIINHKRRGPRLMKSFSEDDVATWKNETDEIKLDENGSAAEKEVPSVSENDNSVLMNVLDSTVDDNSEPSAHGDAKDNHLNGVCSDKHGSSDMQNSPAGKNGVIKSVNFTLPKDDEVGDSIEPEDSVSVKSNDESEVDAGAERFLSATTPMSVFYDAWEELSSEGGTQFPLPDIETEWREIRLGLLMEIEKRKQAEETLDNLRNQWQRICEQLSLVGLNLPADPTALGEGGEPADAAADLCQQVFLARFVSSSIGRGIAKAEVEMEMEAQLKLKNFEITRLWDRLHYYEAVNQEMSQRNQEVVEMSRRLRQRRNRRWKLIWGSIATVVTVGSSFLAYSYFQSGKGSSSQSPSYAPEVEHDQ